MATIWHSGIVTKIEQIASKVRQFELTIDGLEQFDFDAGQFITMDLPIGEKRLQRWRSYSIASAPDSTNVLRFCIGKLEGGLATTYLFDEVKVGTAIKFKGPDGNFCLSDKNEKDIVMICTGTGIAPFKSMIESILANKIKYKSIHLIFGCRTESDILYRSEIENYCKMMPNVFYDIALSRELLSGTHHGYVHDIYMEKYAKKRDDVHFMLCGWSAMIDEAVANLLVKIGYERTQIQYELYG